MPASRARQAERVAEAGRVERRPRATERRRRRPRPRASAPRQSSAEHPADPPADGEPPRHAARQSLRLRSRDGEPGEVARAADDECRVRRPSPPRPARSAPAPPRAAARARGGHQTAQRLRASGGARAGRPGPRRAPAESRADDRSGGEQPTPSFRRALSAGPHRRLDGSAPGPLSSCAMSTAQTLALTASPGLCAGGLHRADRPRTPCRPGRQRHLRHSPRAGYGRHRAVHPDGHHAEGTLAIRNAKRTLQAYQAVVAPDASVPLIEVTVREASGHRRDEVGSGPTARPGDLQGGQRGGGRRQRDGHCRRGSSGPSAARCPTSTCRSRCWSRPSGGRARLRPRDGQVPFFNLGGGQTVEAKVSPLGADSLAVAIGNVEFHLRVDPAGRVLGGSIPAQQRRGGPAGRSARDDRASRRRRTLRPRHSTRRPPRQVDRATM